MDDDFMSTRVAHSRHAFVRAGDHDYNFVVPKHSILLSIARSGDKTIGLFADEIRQDKFVIEYTGEFIKHVEYYRRYAKSCGNRHYYGVQFSDGETIDATRQGSLARFANHSWAPNCTLERWDVNGKVCCDLFAASLIGTEAIEVRPVSLRE
ncbi:SET domain [Phytophthora cactorum]|nr:SET domain [Phytophthora cactorum]